MRRPRRDLPELHPAVRRRGIRENFEVDQQFGIAAKDFGGVANDFRTVVEVRHAQNSESSSEHGQSLTALQRVWKT